MSVGPAAALDVPALLTQLDRYPYGCAEQTVSRALPLVYANTVAAQIGLGEDREIRARVQKAIERVFEMQDASGAFGAWGPSGGDMWLTSYVTDFLTRAKEAGYPVTSARLCARARAVAELRRLRAGARERRRGARLCALRARPQRPRADGRAALRRRHPPRPLHEPARQGAARRGARHDRRQGARRARLQGRCRAWRHPVVSPAPTTARPCATRPRS